MAWRLEPVANIPGPGLGDLLVSGIKGAYNGISDTFSRAFSAADDVASGRLTDFSEKIGREAGSSLLAIPVYDPGTRKWVNWIGGSRAKPKPVDVDADAIAAALGMNVRQIQDASVNRFPLMTARKILAMKAHAPHVFEAYQSEAAASVLENRRSFAPAQRAYALFGSIARKDAMGPGDYDHVGRPEEHVDHEEFAAGERMYLNEIDDYRNRRANRMVRLDPVHVPAPVPVPVEEVSAPVIPDAPILDFEEDPLGDFVRMNAEEDAIEAAEAAAVHDEILRPYPPPPLPVPGAFENMAEDRNVSWRHRRIGMQGGDFSIYNSLRSEPKRNQFNFAMQAIPKYSLYYPALYSFAIDTNIKLNSTSAQGVPFGVGSFYSSLNNSYGTIACLWGFTGQTGENYTYSKSLLCRSGQSARRVVETDSHNSNVTFWRDDGGYTRYNRATSYFQPTYVGDLHAHHPSDLFQLYVGLLNSQRIGNEVILKYLKLRCSFIGARKLPNLSRAFGSYTTDKNLAWSAIGAPTTLNPGDGWVHSLAPDWIPTLHRVMVVVGPTSKEFDSYDFFSDPEDFYSPMAIRNNTDFRVLHDHVYSTDTITSVLSQDVVVQLGDFQYPGGPAEDGRLVYEYGKTSSSYKCFVIYGFSCPGELYVTSTFLSVSPGVETCVPLGNYLPSRVLITSMLNFYDA